MPHALLFVFNAFQLDAVFFFCCFSFNFFCICFFLLFRCFHSAFDALFLQLVCDSCLIRYDVSLLHFVFFSLPSHIIGLFSFWFRLNDYNARWRHVWFTVFAIDAKCNISQEPMKYFKWNTNKKKLFINIKSGERVVEKKIRSNAGQTQMLEHQQQ